MDAQQQPPGPDPGADNLHPNRLVNEDPVSGLFYLGVAFIESYGWLLLLGAVVLLYVRSKLSPKLQDMRRQYEDERSSKKFDAGTAQARLEAMEAARRRLQEQHDQQAQAYAEKMRAKEEEKRKQKIEDWEGHQQGKGYRSKIKPKEEPSTSQGNLPKPKAKLRPADYSPLAGGSGGSCSWRPGQRRTGGG